MKEPSKGGLGLGGGGGGGGGYFILGSMCDILIELWSAEVGLVGGMPAGGMQFGAAHNADSVMPCSTMIDLIHGGRLDATVLGCAEVSPSRDSRAEQDPCFIF